MSTDTDRHIRKMCDLLARNVITPAEFGVCVVDHMAMDCTCDPNALLVEMSPVGRDAVLACLRKYAATDYFFIPFMIGPPTTEQERKQSAREMQPRFRRVGKALSEFLAEGND